VSLVRRPGFDPKPYSDDDDGKGYHKISLTGLQFHIEKLAWNIVPIYLPSIVMDLQWYPGIGLYSHDSILQSISSTTP
jgi:hypothetical protein